MSCDHKNPVVGIIMGSDSDMPAMEACMKQLDEFHVPYEVKVASAHRKPLEVHEWAESAEERGIRVIVAAVFAPIIGVQAVWYAVPMGWAANYIISFMRYLTGKWSRVHLISGK